MPKYSEARPMSFVVGIVLASIGFFLWYFILDGIESRTLGNIAERLTVIIMAAIYLYGIIAGVVVTKFIPEKSSW
jgi:drug/metabolite transporter (DMT)-like permease